MGDNLPVSKQIPHNSQLETNKSYLVFIWTFFGQNLFNIYIIHETFAHTFHQKSNFTKVKMVGKKYPIWDAHFAQPKH